MGHVEFSAIDGHVQRLIDVYEKAGSVETSPGKFTTVNELTDQVPAARPDTLLAAAMALVTLGPWRGNKVLSEEDKGAVLAGLVSTMVRLPLAMARHNVTYKIPGSIVVPLSMEYMSGELTVNGIERGDELILIDDTLASGGTIIALAKAAREAGADIVDVRVVTEKMGYGGRERLRNEAGLDVKSVIGITLDDHGKVKVTHVFGDEIFELA